MIRVLNTNQIRQIEKEADDKGLSYGQMMQNAGYAVARLIGDLIAGIQDPTVTFLIGRGNNGGDGLVAARTLVQIDPRAQIRLYLLHKRDNDPLFETAREICTVIAYAADDGDKLLLHNLVVSSDLILDALFGIGVRLPLQGEAAATLYAVNQAIELQNSKLPTEEISYTITPDPAAIRSATPKIIAVDCPSGLDCDTGALDTQAIFADATISFIAAKPGLLTFPGAAAVGKLFFSTIGIPDDLTSLQQGAPVLVTSDIVRDLLPARCSNANKGSYGKVLIVAGSSSYIGAAGLASEAAYRTGIGLVSVAAPPVVATSLAAAQIETTWIVTHGQQGELTPEFLTTLMEHLPRYDSLLIGPGIGQTASTEQFLLKLLAQVNTVYPSIPLTVDADALNILAKQDQWWELLPGDTIITPHPGEMARLSKMSIAEIQQDRIDSARQFSKTWRVTVVLKGAHTIIASPNTPPTILPFKNDALSTAGTGDILAGLITGFRAQSLDAYNSSLVGGYVHGLAGELTLDSSCSRAVMARDVLLKLPDALTKLSS